MTLSDAPRASFNSISSPFIISINNTTNNNKKKQFEKLQINYPAVPKQQKGS
jgi:hypothetical protein